MLTGAVFPRRLAIRRSLRLYPLQRRCIVADTAGPTMVEILDALDRLSDRVATSSGSRLDGFVSLSMRRAAEELRRYIPGLDLPSYLRAGEVQTNPPSAKFLEDQSRAAFLARASSSALEDGNAREALTRALRGLSLAPHDPNLWFLVASACFEFGAVEDAVRALRHTIWLHPGHRPARRDLAALNLYLRDRWNSSEEARTDRGDDPRDFEPGMPDIDFSPTASAMDRIAPTNTDGTSEDDLPRPDAEEEHDSDE